MVLNEVRDLFIREAPDRTVILDSYVIFIIIGLLLLLIGCFMNFGGNASTITLWGITGRSLLPSLNSPNLFIIGAGAFSMLYSAVLLKRRIEEIRKGGI